MDERHLEELAQHEVKIKSLERRMTNCEEKQTELGKLVSSVEKLAVNMEYMLKEQKEQGTRLTELENAPTEEYKYVKRQVISCIITGVLGAVLGAILTLIF